MNTGRENRSTQLSVCSPVDAPLSSPPSGDGARIVPFLPRTSRPAVEPAPLLPQPPPHLEPSRKRARWVRPSRPFGRSFHGLIGPQRRLPLPHIPDVIPEEEATSLGALAMLLKVYHRTVPLQYRDEYVATLMKQAGELAGRLVRRSLDERCSKG